MSAGQGAGVAQRRIPVLTDGECPRPNRPLLDDTPGFERVIVGELFHACCGLNVENQKAAGWPGHPGGQPEQAPQIRRAYVHMRVVLDNGGSTWDFLWHFLIIFAWIAYLLVLFQILGDLFRRDHKTSGWVKAI